MPTYHGQTCQRCQQHLTGGEYRVTCHGTCGRKVCHACAKMQNGT